jgi:hypothetical protein
MRYVFVLVLSLVSGGAVYFLTLRTGQQEQLAGLGFAPEAPARRRQHEDAAPPVPETDPETIGASGALGTSADQPVADEPAAAPTARAGPGYTYLRVATSGPSSRERLQGFVGLIILITVSAAVLALAVYQTGHVINQTIEHFLK